MGVVDSVRSNDVLMWHELRQGFPLNSVGNSFRYSGRKYLSLFAQLDLSKNIYNRYSKKSFCEKD